MTTQTTPRPSARRPMWMAAFALLFTVLMAAPPVPSAALTREGLAVSAQNPVAQRTYPALQGNTVNSGTLLTNWFTCGNLHTYCDVIQLDVDPQELTHYFVQVELSWPNAAADDRDGNVLHLAVWEIDEDDVLCCRASRTEGVEHPRRVTVIADEPEPLTVHLIVDNFSGSNAGYTVRVQLAEIDPDAEAAQWLAGRRTPAPATPAATPLTSPRTPVRADAAPIDVMPAPQPTPREVKLPGPDGEPRQVTLPVLQSGAREPVQPTGFARVAPILAGFLFAAAGSVVVAWRRRRATT